MSRDVPVEVAGAPPADRANRWMFAGMCGGMVTWGRRQRLGSLDFLRSTEIEAPVTAVWDFCYRPESALVTSDHCISGRSVGGTPRGKVGEWQTFTYVTNGKRHSRTIKVVELQPGREATTIPLDGPLLRLAPRTTTQVASLDHDRALLTLIQSYRVKEEALDALPDGFHDGTLAWIDEYLRRVKEHVESTQSNLESHRLA